MTFSWKAIFKEFFSSVKLIRDVYWRQKALGPLFAEGVECEMEVSRTAMLLHRDGELPVLRIIQEVVASEDVRDER